MEEMINENMEETSIENIEEISNENMEEETNSMLSLLYDNVNVFGTITTFIPLEDILSTLPRVCKIITYLTIPSEIMKMQRADKPSHLDANDTWSCNLVEDLIFMIKWKFRKNRALAFNAALLVSLSIDENICLDKILRSLIFITQLGLRMKETCNVCNNDLEIIISEFGLHEIPSEFFDNTGNTIILFYLVQINSSL